MNEVELGKIILSYLAGKHPDATLYQEPEFHDGRRPDIVVDHGDALEIVELKREPTGAAMDQLCAWRGLADKLTLGCIETGPAAFCRAQKVLEGWGGMIEVFNERSASYTIMPEILPARTELLRACLEPEVPVCAPAGSTGHPRYTALKRTMQRLRARTPREWCRLMVIVGAVDHHYQSDSRARRQIVKHWRGGRMRWAEMKFRRGEWSIRRKGP